MNRWLIAALVLGASCFVCSGVALVLGLLSADGSDGPTGATSAGCSDTVDGWHQAIGPRGLVLTRDGVTAEQAWSFEFTDALRQGDSEMNVWRAVLGDRYEPGQLVQGQFGELHLAGPATERSTGRTVFIAFTSGATGGYAHPVAVIGADASTLAAYPTSAALNALTSLNRFSLPCARLEGRWKSGFNTVAERYAAATGRFTGIEAVAAWRDLTLERGSFRRESSALLNGVFSRQVDSGAWSHDEWSLVLEPEGAEAITYDAAFIAVQHGFLLRLVNRKFSSDVEEFQQVE
jgi:hypothetical protein